MDELLEALESTIEIATRWYADSIDYKVFNIAMADIIRISTLLSDRYYEAHK